MKNNENTASQDGVGPKEKIVQRVIEDEMKKSYLAYSMSVIVGRALPDVRDGLKPVHRRVLFAMHELGLQHNKPFRKSARVVGECFVKNTLILTNNGLIPIQDIKRGEIVFTQKNKCKVTELYEMPEQELLRIKLKNGVTNTVTKSQKIKVLTPQLNLEWKEAKDLKEEEYVVIKADYPSIANYIYLGEIDSKKIHLNEDIAYLIGQLLSDGWVEKGYNRGKGFRCGFSSSSFSTISKVAIILEREFDYAPTVEIKDNEIHSTSGQILLSRMYSIRINKTIINELLTNVFKLKLVDAYTKTIPLQFFMSPKSVIFSLISGMVDGDGSIHKDRCVIHYGSVSETMINQLQLLLQHIGIFATKYSEKCLRDGTINNRKINHNYILHSLEIRGNFALQLAKSLKSYDEKKSERIKSLLTSENLKAPYYDEIPYAGRIIFDELSNYHIGSGWYKDTDMNKFRLGIKYPGGSKIRYPSDLKDKMLTRTQIINWNIQKKLNMIGSPFAEFINHVIDDNVYFLQIEKIENTPAEKTYDIQVENEHEFIANSVVSHNCLGKFHPHGDTAVYDTMVRMSQPFSLRYPLIDGQGNWGSVDGDSAAAQRYTECRLQKTADDILEDIDKDTVDFQDNFDASLKEPKVLPCKLPNMLINGSSGIAVGMATNIPPHNMGEIIDGTIKVIDNPDISSEELIKFVHGPDFPTGAIICGRNGIKHAYSHGKGRLIVRGKHTVEENKGKPKIIITEIPYLVNKSILVSQIAQLVKDKIIEGITDLRDESNKEGIRIILELRHGTNSEVVLNQLYKHSRMQVTFGVIMLALVNNIPKVLNLRQMIQHFILHRKVVVTRRTKFELKKAEDRVHILEGLIIALDNIDEVIQKIKASKDTQTATQMLIGNYNLTETQAKAILDMRLQRLSGLERDKIRQEHIELIELIKRLKEILASEQEILNIIKKELAELKEKYNDKRRTEIIDMEVEDTELDMADLIEQEDVIITITHEGYIKRTPVSIYKEQRRGGKGVIATAKKDEDFVEDVFACSTHSYILFFTNKGRVYWLKGYDIPEGSRQARGKAIVNLVSLDSDEKVNAVIPVKEFDEKHYLVLATKNGTVKKTNLIEYSRPRQGGIIAITLDDNDELINAVLTDGNKDIVLATKNGNAIRFSEEDARAIGRSAKGVRGITLRENDQVVSMVIADENKSLLTITENGYGKRTSIEEYRRIGRGGIGVINIQTTERNGYVVSVKSVDDNNDVMLISRNGIVIRTPTSGISLIGRNTQGVTLMRLDDTDKVVAAAKIVNEDKL